MNGIVLPSSSNPTTLSTCTLRIWKSCAMREQSSVVTSCIVNPPRDGRRGQKNGCGGRSTRLRPQNQQFQERMVQSATLERFRQGVKSVNAVRIEPQGAPRTRRVPLVFWWLTSEAAVTV